jgi:hypothetical protein
MPQRPQWAPTVTNGHQWFREAAGRQPPGSCSRHDVGRRFRLRFQRSWWCIGAADGQQPVSVTTGESARKPWRIMTADPASTATDLAFLTCLPQSSTPRSSLQECPYRSRTEEVTGSIPSPPPHNTLVTGMAGAPAGPRTFQHRSRGSSGQHRAQGPVPPGTCPGQRRRRAGSVAAVSAATASAPGRA